MIDKKTQGKRNRQAGARFELKDTSKYSEENKRRWSDQEYKKRVSEKISLAHKKRLSEGKKHSRLGKQQTDESKEKIRNSDYHKNLKGTKKGIKNHNWKGDFIKYGSMHQWINNNFKISEKCELCGSSTRKLEWSNKDHKYSRERKDWQSICRFCHRRHDNDL